MIDTWNVNIFSSSDFSPRTQLTFAPHLHALSCVEDCSCLFPPLLFMFILYLESIDQYWGESVLEVTSSHKDWRNLLINEQSLEFNIEIEYYVNIRGVYLTIIMFYSLTGSIMHYSGRGVFCPLLNFGTISCTNYYRVLIY